MYTKSHQGRGSSAVGLTVSVTRDPDTREFVLESGAVVLANGGVCCIDEFDKMEDNARAILHEVMEQQSVTVAKAGIVASLNARTAILASANPINSRYDRQRAVIENINLPPSLFSRFDLIYLLLDSSNPQADKSLAYRLCQAFAGDPNIDTESHSPPLSKSLLSSYLSYCRYRCHPTLSLEAKEALKQEYLRMRRRDVTSKHPSASIRQLESLLRLSEAIAKLRVSRQVTAADAAEAVRLVHVATFQSLVDPFSGRIDFDQIHVGQSRQQRLLQQRCSEALQQVLLAAAANGSGPLSKEDLHAKVQELLKLGGGSPHVDMSTLSAALQQLEEDQIVSRKPGGLFHATVVAS
ncbi:DNA replication licensing factor, putative [Eimeria maxima]|uniref:DNA helicase n=1 Tax=Eimeria maxima TaxID=5804 RepID=U6MEJ7_EIMMA|nr:DNA replication licensing factor, putative [Eimeria maxima]CDJ60070.1 DNA replication licensing factor, putative [Eimeria maxima]